MSGTFDGKELPNDLKIEEWKLTARHVPVFEEGEDKVPTHVCLDE